MKGAGSMSNQLSEDYITACMAAKQTIQFLPNPPVGLQRRHVYLIKICHDLSQKLNEVRVSDIAETVNVTMPSITRDIKVLEENGYLVKEENSEDKRVVNLQLTPKGIELYQNLIYDFHKKNSELLKEIPEEEIKTTIQTIIKIYNLMEQEYL